MSALTEVSEMDELKAAVANTGEPRLIALLERLAIVEGKLADGSDLRAAIDAWSPPTSSGQAAKTRLAALLTRLEAVEATEAAPSKVDPAAIAALKKDLENACMAHNFSPKRAGRPSNIEKDFQAFKERLNSKAVAHSAYKSNYRGASRPLLNHDLHAIDATRAADSLFDLCTGRAAQRDQEPRQGRGHRRSALRSGGIAGGRRGRQGLQDGDAVHAETGSAPGQLRS